MNYQQQRLEQQAAEATRGPKYILLAESLP